MLGNPSTHPRGEVITFYSYKGGTGRTMALANVACLLAERLRAGERVLVVDWDLEAPGLHRFFPGRLGHTAAMTDLGLDAIPGVIDIFAFFDATLPLEPAPTEEAADQAVSAVLAKLSLEQYVVESGIPSLQILRAGRDDDGEYSKRVNTFNWERLFHRAPSIYRRFAERLAQEFRYVLIDSRTGVTDISGICTSLFPEKLVVVFTPNRQSLTGVRELIRRATSYRRTSDDLRPLLVYPLPSRIEASREDLRKHWRFGDRDLNVVGYQPMFEGVLAEAYGLSACDLKAYFEDVQIQQTPDYAYGEEIAVRRSGDRFSLGNSFRVFVDRLVTGAPPWAQPEERSKSIAPVIETNSDPPAVDGPAPRVEPGVRAAEKGRRSSGGPRIFVSYARADLERVQPIVRAFRERGWNVSFEHGLQSGKDFRRTIADELDAADAVVVFWSEASRASDWVLDEASEGLRRGVLVPVLLDDVVPPLGFRQVQSADLRRPESGSLQRLLDDVALVALGGPGTPRTGAVLTSETVRATHRPSVLSQRRIRSRVLPAAMAATVVLALAMTIWLQRRSLPSANTSDPSPNVAPPASTNAPPPPINTGTPPSPDLSAGTLRAVPNFVGAQTSDVQRTADLLGLPLTMRDERGKEAPFLEGVVTSQKPEAGSPLNPRTRVQLQVAAVTAVVPTLVRSTLNRALPVLEQARLRLGATQSREVGDAEPGTIISQNPEPGTRVAAGGAVDVIVAAPRSTGKMSSADVAAIERTLQQWREKEGAAMAASAFKEIVKLPMKCAMEFTRTAVLESPDRRAGAMADADAAIECTNRDPSATGTPRELRRDRLRLRFQLVRSSAGWTIQSVQSRSR